MRLWLGSGGRRTVSFPWWDLLCLATLLLPIKRLEDRRWARFLCSQRWHLVLWESRIRGDGQKFLEVWASFT